MINNVPCELELDTGATVTVIPKEIWQKELGSVPLQKSNVTLRSYSGHLISVSGETAVHDKYGSQELDLSIIVTTPQYFKSRPVPYALREKAENELKRLVKERVLKKV